MCIMTAFLHSAHSVSLEAFSFIPPSVTLPKRFNVSSICTSYDSGTPDAATL